MIASRRSCRTFYFMRTARDYDHLSDIARIGRPGRHHHLGGIVVMPKSLMEIRSLARSHTRTAVNVLVGIMRSKDATAAARVSAANAILDRGWGKAAQPLQNGDDGALELIHRIERVIVSPENSDSKNL
jgi:hypothetical protein